MKWSGREQGEASEARVDAGTNDSKEQDLEIRDITWGKKNGGFKTVHINRKIKWQIEEKMNILNCESGYTSMMCQLEKQKQ